MSHPECSTVYTLVNNPPTEQKFPYSSSGTKNLIPSGYSSIWTRSVDAKFSSPSTICPITGCQINSHGHCGSSGHAYSEGYITVSASSFTITATQNNAAGYNGNDNCIRCFSGVLANPLPDIERWSLEQFLDCSSAMTPTSNFPPPNLVTTEYFDSSALKLYNNGYE